MIGEQCGHYIDDMLKQQIKINCLLSGLMTYPADEVQSLLLWYGMYIFCSLNLLVCFHTFYVLEENEIKI